MSRICKMCKVSPVRSFHPNTEYCHKCKVIADKIIQRNARKTKLEIVHCTVCHVAFKQTHASQKRCEEDRKRTVVDKNKRCKCGNELPSLRHTHCDDCKEIVLDQQGEKNRIRMNEVNRIKRMGV